MVKVQAVLRLQYGALWHLVACTNLVGFRLTFHILYSKPGLKSTDLEPQRHINKIEAIVPATCLCTWPNLIRGSLWLHFIDNDGALSCLVSGCSRNSSLSAVVDFLGADTCPRLLAVVRKSTLRLQHRRRSVSEELRHCVCKQLDT